MSRGNLGQLVSLLYLCFRFTLLAIVLRRAYFLWHFLCVVISNRRRLAEEAQIFYDAFKSRCRSLSRNSPHAAAARASVFLDSVFLSPLRAGALTSSLGWCIALLTRQHRRRSCASTFHHRPLQRTSNSAVAARARAPDFLGG